MAARAKNSTASPGIEQERGLLGPRVGKEPHAGPGAADHFSPSTPMELRGWEAALCDLCSFRARKGRCVAETERVSEQ